MKFIFLLSIFFFNITCYDSDLTLIGYITPEDGIGQIIPNIINTLKNDIKIKVFSTRGLNKNSLGNDKFILHTWLSHLNLTKKSSDKLNVIYLMCETTQFPKQTVNTINKNFDAVVVPDEFLTDVFLKSGIKIPIYVLPMPLNLQKFLSVPAKKTQNKIFTFGCTAAFWERKNHLLLIEAFHREFNNDSSVKLILNGRFGEMYPILIEYIKKNKLKNVEIKQNCLNQDDYLGLLQSFDCFILISKGEGFSIGPREAMALGIPCILSNNTAHKTICKTNLVSYINANIIRSALNGLKSQQIGFNFDCKITDVCNVMRQIYENYSLYLFKAIQGRNWVKQYLAENLRKKYLNLIKPKKIILGKKNILTDDFIMTDSKILYIKYKKIFNI